VDFFFEDEPPKASTVDLDLLFASSAPSSSAFLDVFSGSVAPTPAVGTTPRSNTLMPAPMFHGVNMTTTAGTTPRSTSMGNSAPMFNGVNMMADLRGTGLLVGPYGGMMGGCIVNVGTPMDTRTQHGMGSFGMGPGGMPPKSPKPNIMDLFGPSSPSPKN